MARGGQPDGFSVACNKRLYLIFTLGPENRAGAKQQATARLEQGPQALQQARRNGSQLRHIGFPAQPAYIRMAAHDARGRTGYIGEYAVKWLPVPPPPASYSLARPLATSEKVGSRVATTRRSNARLGSASRS